MKLYATVTSERATKGQGGNDYLKIDLLDEGHAQYARLTVSLQNEANEPHLKLYYLPKKCKFIGAELELPYRAQLQGERKGEQQKGDCKHEYYANNGYCWKCNKKQA